uniref:Uncharacterized protein n=1 Tax=Arundo donax TaxID=35708 RepID=A0A0A8Y1N8_ARUDO
MAWFVIGG